MKNPVAKHNRNRPQVVPSKRHSGPTVDEWEEDMGEYVLEGVFDTRDEAEDYMDEIDWEGPYEIKSFGYEYELYLYITDETA